MLWLVGPGVLVAATGVGAGDLAAGALAGSRLGLAVLWAVLAGAIAKLVLTEALARWQMATRTTILEGAMRHLGRPAQLAFFLYLVPWSFFVGSALIAACGATAHALVSPLAAPELSPQAGKAIFGVACSIAGLALVRLGGFKLFERVMAVCVGLMFAVVLVSAVAVRPDAGEVLRGLLVPRVPAAGEQGVGWTLGLIGGVGGTLTIICYGYWMREVGRDAPSALGVMRLDATIGYAMTALFGIAMVIIGSGVPVEGGGASLLVRLAERLEGALGVWARWAFLLGAFCAVFSSLLGVWQAVPYIYADFWNIIRAGESNAPAGPPTTSEPVYRWGTLALAIVPLPGLFLTFSMAQKLYTVFGALFVPALAVVLLLLTPRRRLMGALRSGPLASALLAAIAAGLLVIAAAEIAASF